MPSTTLTKSNPKLLEQQNSQDLLELNKLIDSIKLDLHLNPDITKTPVKANNWDLSTIANNSDQHNSSNRPQN